MKSDYYPYTKKEIEDRTSDYVCFDCGKPYQLPSQRDLLNIVTVHQSECGLCHQNKGVTHYRAFNYLQFQVLPKKRKIPA